MLGRRHGRVIFGLQDGPAGVAMADDDTTRTDEPAKPIKPLMPALRRERAAEEAAAAAEAVEHAERSRARKGEPVMRTILSAIGAAASILVLAAFGFAIWSISTGRNLPEAIDGAVTAASSGGEGASARELANLRRAVDDLQDGLAADFAELRENQTTRLDDLSRDVADLRARLSALEVSVAEGGVTPATVVATRPAPEMADGDFAVLDARLNALDRRITAIGEDVAGGLAYMVGRHEEVWRAQVEPADTPVRPVGGE